MRTASRLCLSLVIAYGLPALAWADVREAMKRAKDGDFDASIEVACSQEVGEDLGTCLAETVREDGGVAVVLVTFPNGFTRMLSFEGDAFLRGNTTMSGVGTDTEWSLVDGLYHIRVDDQRFRIPKTLVSGK